MNNINLLITFVRRRYTVVFLHNLPSQTMRARSRAYILRHFQTMTGRLPPWVRIWEGRAPQCSGKKDGSRELGGRLVVVVFYCPYAQSTINCGEDISVLCRYRRMWTLRSCWQRMLKHNDGRERRE